MFKPLGIAVVALGTLAVPASAAMQRFGSFVIDDASPEILVLLGTLQQNAPIDLRRALRRFPDISILALQSGGGDVTAGLLVAQEIFDRGIETYIPEGAGCYSACAYIFFAGKVRRVDGELGVHQMANDSSDLYSVQVAVSDMLDTMAEFAIPPGVFSEMLRTAPDDMRIYSAAEASSLGLNRVAVEAIASVPDTLPAISTPFATGIGANAPSAPSLAYDVGFPTAIYLAASGSEKATPAFGEIWWSRTADPAGGDMIVAELSVSQPHMTIEAKVKWRKNTDPTLPAEATMEVTFSYLGPGVADEIAAMPGVLGKDDPTMPGRPLVGASAKVQSGEFLFALTNDEVDATENSIVLVERYIDLAVVLKSGRSALLTLGKDDSAEAMFRDVLESWVD